MQNITKFVSTNLNFDFLNLNLSSSSWKAFAIVGLIFLLVLTLAQVRRHFIDWSFKGAVFGIFFGFLLALFLEGFLIIGGRTAVTELLGWKKAPKPIQTAVDLGRAKLVEVLGVTDVVPQSNAQGDLIDIFQSLNPIEAKRIKSLICEP